MHHWKLEARMSFFLKAYADMSSNLHAISLEELCHENCFPLFFARSFYCSFLFLSPSSGLCCSLFCLLYEMICNTVCKRICLNFCLKGLSLLCGTPRRGSKDKKQEVMTIFFCLFVCSYFWLIFPLVAVLPITVNFWCVRIHLLCHGILRTRKVAEFVRLGNYEIELRCRKKN